MSRFVSGLIALALLVAMESISFAQTSSLGMVRSLSSTAPGADREAISRIYLPMKVGVTESQMARFVECHISRHPLLGPRMVERTCPLLVAEARDTDSSVPADSEVAFVPLNHRVD
jgi:hypothetical protein